MKKTNRKLSINKETLRSLTDPEMAKVAGGEPPTSYLGSRCLGCGYSDDATCYSCVTFCPSACGTCIYC